MNLLSIQLPFPPSVNSYWRTVPIRGVNRTLLSEKGREYKRTVKTIVMVSGIKRQLFGRLACTIHLYPPDNRVRDIDNYSKALLDALGAAGVYSDDSQIKEQHIFMEEKREPGCVLIQLCETEMT